MFKKFFIAFIFLFSTFILIYPSKKENTDLFDYCFSLEKILSINSVEKIRNVPKRAKTFAKDITSFGIDKTKGVLANKIIDQYKTSKKIFIIKFVPNQFYCLAGYWIERINPGTIESLLYEKSKKRINKYKDIKKEVDEFIKEINSIYQ